MNCSVAPQMCGAYVDGELDASSEFQLQLHVSECASRTTAVERLQMRSRLIRRGGLRYEAPVELKRRPKEHRDNIWKAIQLAITGRSGALYERRRHLIDLFIWPARSERLGCYQPLFERFQCYSLDPGGMSFAVVSDLNKSELEQFRNLFNGS